MPFFSRKFRLPENQCCRSVGFIYLYHANSNNYFEMKKHNQARIFFYLNVLRHLFFIFTFYFLTAFLKCAFAGLFF